MGKCKYVKQHNNYDLTIGKEYEFRRYNNKWLLILEDDKNHEVLYRIECFTYNGNIIR